MLLNVCAHELAEHLGGRFVLRPASLEELLTEIALNPYAETNILHGQSVPNGYTYWKLEFGVAEVEPIRSQVSRTPRSVYEGFAEIQPDQLPRSAILLIGHQDRFEELFDYPNIREPR